MGAAPIFKKNNQQETKNNNQWEKKTASFERNMERKTIENWEYLRSRVISPGHWSIGRKVRFIPALRCYRQLFAGRQRLLLR